MKFKFQIKTKTKQVNKQNKGPKICRFIEELEEFVRKYFMGESRDQISISYQDKLGGK